MLDEKLWREHLFLQCDAAARYQALRNARAAWYERIPLRHQASWLGAIAGFYATYSGNVAPALHGLEGPVYAVVQSALNRHVRHAALWCALALLPAWRGRGTWGWGLLAAGVLYAAGVVTRDRWNAANHLRTVVSGAAFLLATASLALRGPARRRPGSSKRRTYSG